MGGSARPFGTVQRVSQSSIGGLSEHNRRRPAVRAAHVKRQYNRRVCTRYIRLTI